MRVFIFCLMISGIGLAQNEKQTEHAKSCPESCKLCEGVVEKAIKFLLSQQKENGAWSLHGLGSGDIDASLSTTCFCGLALLAGGTTLKEGPYQKELQKAKEAAVKGAQGLLGARRKSPVTGKMTFTSRSHRHTLPYTVLFLGHIYEMDKSEELKKLLEGLAGAMKDQQGPEGGWSYTGPGGTMTFMANNYVLAMVFLKHLGIEVDVKALDLARGFYTNSGIQANDGRFGYFGRGGDPVTRGVGRTADALLSMKLLGLADSDTYKKAKEFVEKNTKDIDLGHHGAAYPLFFGGIGCFHSGHEDIWKKYVSAYRDVIVKSQKEDGSIFVRPREATFWPIDTEKAIVYTTALYCAILQLAKNHLMFGKIKPVDSNENKK